VVVDLGEALRWFDRMVAFVDALPLVQANPELRAAWGDVRAKVQAGLGVAAGFLGIELRKDLGFAAAGVVLSKPFTYAAVVSGRVPSDLLARIAKPDKLYRLADRDCVRLEPDAWLLPDGDRVLLASSDEALGAALARKDAADLLARHPGVRAALPAGTLVRVSFSPPAWIRASASASVMPLTTLVENLRSATLDLGPEVRLWAEAGNADGLDRTKSLFEAVREGAIAGGGIVRALGHMALALDLDRLPAKDAATRQLLGNREAIRKSLDQVAGTSTLPKPVKVQGMTVELRLDAGTTSGTLFLTGMLAAIAVPQFQKYMSRARSAEAHSNLRNLAMAETLYKEERGEYLACAPVPRQPPSGDSVPWPGSECFDRLGFSPQGKVFFSYETKVEKDRFTVRAVGDPDGTGKPRVFVLTGPGPLDAVVEEGAP
jgi:hypothetical protein